MRVIIKSTQFYKGRKIQECVKEEHSHGGIASHPYMSVDGKNVQELVGMGIPPEMWVSTVKDFIDSGDI